MALSSQAGESPDALLQSLRKPLQSETQSERLTIALLGFENRTGDSEAEHWQVALDRVVSRQLGTVKSVRLAPGVEYALRQINKKKKGDAIDAAQARKAGEVIEARRVVWGEYKRIGEKWEVAARVLNVAKGSVSKDLKVRGSDWFEIGDKLTDELLKEFKVAPTRAEREKMLKRWTKSSETLAWMSKAKLLQGKGKQQSELENWARRATEADPQCGLAHGLLASIVGTAGRLEEAEKDARRAEELSRDSAFVHRVLGFVLLLQGKDTEAEHEFQEAVRLDPDDSENYERLGELYDMREDGAKALGSFRRASQLDPYSSSIHARLGSFYASQTEQQKALEELREAERLAPADDASTEQFLSNGYQKLRDVPSTILHCDKFVALAKAQGLNPDFVKGYESTLAELRARLTPTFVKADQPTSLSDQDVAKMLRGKLSGAEMTTVTNPLVSTAEMVNWSRKLTAGATNDFDKGKILLETLAHRATRGVGRWRTAEQVYDAWNDNTISFRCEEYAYLYVALARALGLKCFFTIVDEECDGHKAPHACAGLFLEDKCLLADPTYFWYGVPHRQFTVLNDVQVIALRLAESERLEDDLAAYKLYPDSPFVCHNLLTTLLNNGKSKEAREIMAKLTQVCKGSEAWRTNLAQGQFALMDEKLDVAIDLLRKTTELNPDIGEPQLMLGGIYLTQGKFIQAREALRKALAGIYDQKTAERAYRTLAHINDLLDGSGDGVISRDSKGYQIRGGIYLSEGDYEKAIENLTEAIRLEPKEETNYRYRALAHVYQHEYDKAMSDCNEALRIKADDSQVYLMRGYAYTKAGEAQKAMADLSETIRLDPKCADAFKYRGWLYADQKEYEKAASDYRDAVRLDPEEADSQSTLAWLLTYCTLRPAAAEAIRAGKASCELTGWTNGSYVSILGAAYGESGDYEHAVEYERQALGCAGVTPEERDLMSQRLEYYEGRRSQAEPNHADEAKSVSANNSSVGSSVGQAMGEAARADLQRAAESGDSAAQLRLANCCYEGTQGFSTNRIEAYKWAMVAAEGGNREGRYLMREAELFMASEELTQAKTAAQKLLESLKKDGTDRK